MVEGADLHTSINSIIPEYNSSNNASDRTQPAEIESKSILQRTLSRRDLLKTIAGGAAATALNSVIPTNARGQSPITPSQIPTDTDTPDPQLIESEALHPNETIITEGRLKLKIDANGVPLEYCFAIPEGPEIETWQIFTPGELAKLSMAHDSAMRLKRTEAGGVLLYDYADGVPAWETIPEQTAIFGEEEATTEKPTDICNTELLKNYGIKIHNPDSDAPQLYIREGAFEPEGRLYILRLVQMLAKSGVQIDARQVEIFFLNGTYVSEEVMNKSQRERFDALHREEIVINEHDLIRNFLGKQESNIKSAQKKIALNRIHSVGEISSDQDPEYNEEVKRVWSRIALAFSLPPEQALNEFWDSEEMAEIYSIYGGLYLANPHLDEVVLFSTTGFPSYDFCPVYTICFDRDGHPHVYKNELKNYLNMNTLVNRGTSHPSPDNRFVEQSLVDDPTYDQYVVGYEDFGFILHHEFIHLIDDYVQRLINANQIILDGHGFAQAVIGSELEKIITEDLKGVKPWFMQNITYPISTEKATDLRAHESMTQAYEQYKKDRDDTGYPFVITLPPERGIPGRDKTRYKITTINQDQHV